MKKPITMIAMLATVFGLCASTFADTDTWFEETATSVTQAMTQDGETEDGVWSNLTDQVEVDAAHVVVDADDETPVAYRPNAVLRGNSASIVLENIKFTAARKTLPALEGVQGAVMITTNAAGECVFAVADNGAWELTEKAATIGGIYKVKVDLHYGVANTVDYSLDEAGSWVAFKTGAVNPVTGAKATTVEIAGSGSFDKMSGERELVDYTISFADIPTGIADIKVNGTSVDQDGKATVVEDSKTVVITFVAADGYRLSSDTLTLPGPITADVAYNSDNFPVTAEKINYVAQIVVGGGATTNKFESLGAAIDALASGETITLLDDYTLTADETKEIAKSCTLDLGTYTLTVPETIRHKKSTGEGEDGSFGVLAGATVTFQNGTIDLGTVGSSYGIAVYGTVNANCTILRSQEGTKINGPVFDIFGGTVNVGVNADITADTDIFRAKDMVSDVAITGTVTVVAGAKLTSTDRHVMFYNYKTYTTMVVTLNGGTLNANSSYGFFGDDTKHPGAPWVVTISPDVVFNCDKIEYGTAVGTVLKHGYGAVARGTDPETYKVDKLTYNVTLTDTTDGTATPATYQIADEAQTVALVAGTPPESKVFDKWVLTEKEGVSISGDTITIAAGTIGDIAVAATWKSVAPDPVEPGADIDIPTGKDINDINTNDAVKAELLKAPGDIETTPAYRALFDAVEGSAAGKVAFVLNSDGTNAVVAAETAADTTVLDAVLDADAVTATVENPLVGFYYSLKQNADVTKLGFKEATDKNKLGGKDTIQFTLEKGDVSEFYQMIVTPAPVK